MSKRITIVFSAILIMMAVLVVRAAFLQILPNNKLKNRYESQFQKAIVLEPSRGLILDAKNKELASSVAAYSFFADPLMIENQKEFISQVSKYLKIPKQKLRKKIKNKNKRFVWLSRKQSKELKDIMEKKNIKGLGILEESKRIYPNLHILSHTLGFVGNQGRGLEGLELKFDDLLSGENQEFTLKRDAKGRPLVVNGQLITEKKDGHHIQLSVDLELQYVLEQELKMAVKSHNAESAMAIILDANTSEILSIANYPTFDSNKFYKAKQKVRRNRLLTDPFEPGSTMKTFTIAAAIRENAYHAKSKIYCEDGKFKVANRWIREADSKHSFGWLKLEEVLAKSSNIGTTKIALALGEKKIYQNLKDFGFGTKVSKNLTGESKGILNPLPWRKHTLGAISFGHSIAATPLQIVNAYAAIANGGSLNKPYIVKKILNSKGELVEAIKPQKIRQVLTKNQSYELKKMLSLATSEEGTGYKANIKGYDVAGKTGTAQKVDRLSGGYLSGEYISSFVGFVPVDKPKYVIYIALDRPEKVFYGSEVAAPIFSRIASYAMLRSGSPSHYITEEKMQKKVDLSASLWAQSRAIDKVKRDFGEKQMPDLEGLYLREALSHLKEENLNIKIKGKGRITKSLPSAGKALKDKGEIVLYLSEDI